MAQRFETRQWVPFPVELVFAFFANPSNLPHLMPPRLKTRIEDALPFGFIGLLAGVPVRRG